MMDQFNKLDNYESRFSDQVWAGVSQHLEAQKKQKRLKRALYFGSAAVVLLTMMVGYYTLSDNSLNQVELVVDSSQKREIDHSLASTKVSLSKDDGYIFNSGVSLVNDSYQNSNVASIEVSKESIIHEQHSEITNDIESSNLALVRTETFIQSSKEAIGVGEIVEESSSDKQQRNIKFNKNELKEEFNSVNLTIASVDAENQRVLPEALPLTQVNRLKSSNSIRSLFFKEGCNLLDASPFKTYVWSQLSALTPISNHTAKSSQFQEFADARRNTESVLISPEFGFGLGVKTKGGYFLESGFQLAYYRERLGYIDPESINVQTIITTDSTFTTTGVEVTTDTTIIEIPGSREVVNYNSHKTVSVPIIIGFDKQLGSSWSVGGKVGTIFNLFKQSEGRILDEEMEVRDIVHNEGSSVHVYKTRLTTQLLLGSQVRYHFSPSLDVYVSADVRFNAKSITLDGYSLNQRFTTPVLGTGMRYYF